MFPCETGFPRRSSSSSITYEKRASRRSQKGGFIPQYSSRLKQEAHTSPPCAALR
jgi:hypothetical protein